MRTIGGYQVLGLLGRGGMGAVYRARHLQLGCVAALKVLAPTDLLEAVVGKAELERRFLAEAQTMAGLRHANIARVWDMGRDVQGRLYFVMEYCCNNVGAIIGESYRVEEPSRVLRIDRAADIARQTLEALARLHFAGIVHRDVKPFNLLLDGDRVRLIDFGLSKLRGERLAIGSAENVGSPYYAAPEQEADPDAADARSDLFAVGVMLWRMLTGRLPQLSSERPSADNPDLDAAWDEFLDRATAEDPARRFSDAGGMLAVLDSLMDAWRARTAGVCSLAEEAAAHSGPVPPPLRSWAVKTGPKAGPEWFGLDRLWRPLVHWPAAYHALDDGTVREEVSGLLWERGGTPYAVERDQAMEHVRALNSARFAGHDDWRLPTVPELASLLRPVAHGRDFCMDSVFDQAAPRLWSADLRSFGSAWTADAELGFIAHHDFTCHLHARAVCGPLSLAPHPAP